MKWFEVLLFPPPHPLHYRMMVMNSLILALEGGIFLETRGQLSSHVIRHWPTWIGMMLKATMYLWCILITWSSNFILRFVNCRALALNCNVPVNDKNGAESKNWKEGKPVRVVRSCKGRKHSKYSPEEGNRYDGIYKVWTESQTVFCVYITAVKLSKQLCCCTSLCGPLFKTIRRKTLSPLQFILHFRPQNILFLCRGIMIVHRRYELRLPDLLLTVGLNNLIFRLLSLVFFLVYHYLPL